ncbi:MAG TPA: histidine kinase [Spirochaetia bacterium]|jgi:two-component system sensor histidine kinase YesM|nr:histidine kinase [Spirochaetia bacterium]
MKVPYRTLRIFVRHSWPLVVVAILLGGVATFLSRNFILQNSMRQASQTLNHISSYYDVILDEMDSLSVMFSTNPEMMIRLQRILEDEAIIDLDNYREIKLIRSFLSAPVNARPYIDNIHVYLENSQKLVLSSNLGFTPLLYLEDSSWYATYKELSPDLRIYSEKVVVKQGSATERHIIRILRPIYAFTGTSIGVIVLDIKENSLSQSISIRDGEFLTVHNPQGQLLFSNPSSPSPYPEDEMQFFSAQSRKYGWNYTLGIYKPRLYELSTTLMKYTIALTAFALLLGLFLTQQTNRQERKFLDNVFRQLYQVGDTDLEGESAESYRNIFDYLNHHVIKTFLEQDYLRWQKEAMEYRALQMQINPHFIFNTLDTINWKAVKLAEGENDVSRMIFLLSRLLKYSLHVDDLEGVQLSKELEMTDCYLQLQQIRFRDSFTVVQKVDPSLLDIMVPSMLFQPILENSFDHGFVEGRALTILLTITEERENARIVISNDGNPLSEEEVERLNGEGVDVLKKKSSIGILNIRKRLMLFSQGKASMVVTSGERQGVSVTILMPCRRT